MVKYGMTPIEAILSSTSRGAKVLGVQEKLGEIKPGFFADIIAVEGDPTKDISNIRKIKFVMKDGNIITKSP
jgi:imidazolonepropionase-like amidohydrolase